MPEPILSDVSQPPIPRYQKLCRMLTYTFGFVSILASWWFCIIVMFMAGKLIVVNAHINGYKPAQFTIEKLIFIKSQTGHGSVAHTSGRIYAEGTVGDKKEELELAPFLSKKVNSQEELEQQFEIGQVLGIYYNPNVPPTVRARLLFPADGFVSYWRNYLYRTVKTALIPLLAGLVLTLLSSWIGRTRAGIGLSILSMFFVLAGIGLALLDVLT